MAFAKLSTAKTFMLGPVLDADGVADEGVLVAAIKVTKNGTVGAPDAHSTLTHDHTGHYKYYSDGDDFDTLGEVTFSLNDGTSAMAPKSFDVMPALTYNTMAAASGGNVPQVAAGGANGLLISGSNTGTTTLGALTVTNATTLSGAVSLGSTLDVVGATTFTGNVAANAGITADIDGSLSGPVGSVGAGGIVAATFGADAITAASIATGALTADAFAADALVAATFATGALTADAFAADAIIAATFATGALTADAFAANALVAATFAASSLDGKGDWNTTVPDNATIVANGVILDKLDSIIEVI